MPAAAFALEQVPSIRRFDLGDLSTHGHWLVPRLTQALNLPEQRIGGWLRCLIDNKEFCFRVQEHSVGCAEVQLVNGLADKPVVRERFVYAEDIDNKAHVAEAAEFYDEFKRWASSLGAEVLIVQEQSDVPDEMIRQKLGRIFIREQRFARL